MCLSSETRAWGVINCGEGGRLSGAVILQMIPASNVEAGNGSMKRHTYTAPARLGHILLERSEIVRLEQGREYSLFCISLGLHLRSKCFVYF